MFDFIRKFPWVLDTHRYTDQTTLLAGFERRGDRPRGCEGEGDSEEVAAATLFWAPPFDARAPATC